MLHLFLYKITVVQKLQPADYLSRVEYCSWFQNHLNYDHLLNISFFSDEAWFHLSGYVNSQNFRIWRAQNPHQFVDSFTRFDNWRVDSSFAYKTD
jgi:hypothetical protein